MLISATKAAEYLGCSYSLLYQLRKAGTGPSYVKLRSYIKYDKDELDRWVRERTIITK